jgi:putative membrane protein
MTRAPRAFRLDNPDVVTLRVDEPAPERTGAVVVTEEPMEAIEAADRVVVPLPRRRRTPWGAILLSALGGLLTLGLGLALERLIVDLFAVAPWLGWLAAVLAALAALALVAIVTREFVGVLRERRIESLREAAAAALSAKDHPGAKRVVADLLALYGGRGETAAARARIGGWSEDISTPRTASPSPSTRFWLRSTPAPSAPSPTQRSRSRWSRQ